MRLLAALAAATLGGLLAAAPATAPAAPPAPDRSGDLLTVWNRTTGAPSTLLRYSPATHRVHAVRTLAYTVNALGYDRASGRAIGVATRRYGRGIGDGGHLLALGAGGTVRDLGAVPGMRPPLAASYAADVVDGRLLLLDRGRLDVVALRPAPHLTRTVRLGRLPWLGDWAANPTDHLLYGLGAVRGGTALVRVDPRTGAVRVGPARRLPGTGSFGAVAIDDTGHLYAWRHGPHHRGMLLRIPLRHKGSVARLATAPELAGSDAAWCPARPTSPSPSPSVSASVSPSPSPSPSPPSSPSSSPSPSRSPSSSPSARPVSPSGRPSPTVGVPPVRPPRSAGPAPGGAPPVRPGGPAPPPLRAATAPRPPPPPARGGPVPRGAPPEPATPRPPRPVPPASRRAGHAAAVPERWSTRTLTTAQRRWLITSMSLLTLAGVLAARIARRVRSGRAGR